MSRTLSADEGKRSVMIRLRLPVFRIYEAQARHERRSLNQLLALALEDYLEEKKKLTEPAIAAAVPTPGGSRVLVGE